MHWPPLTPSLPSRTSTAMSHSPDHSPTSSLFCGEDVGEAISDHPPSPTSPTVLFPACDEAAIGGLIDAEIHHMPERDYLQRCRDRFVDTTARSDAIDWILKVVVINNPLEYWMFDLSWPPFGLVDWSNNAGARILPFSSSNGVSLR